MSVRNRFHPAVGLLLLLVLIPIWVPLLVLASLWYLAAFVSLHLAVWMLWLPRRKRLLFVYSESPIWLSHIQEKILPLIREHAVILNWSQRKQWSFCQAIAVAVFRFFGGRREFNPLAVVFRPFRVRRVFRFFGPFQDFKHGHQEALAKLEAELFGYLRLEDAP